MIPKSSSRHIPVLIKLCEYSLSSPNAVKQYQLLLLFSLAKVWFLNRVDDFDFYQYSYPIGINYSIYTYTKAIFLFLFKNSNNIYSARNTQKNYTMHSENIYLLQIPIASWMTSCKKSSLLQMNMRIFRRWTKGPMQQLSYLLDTILYKTFQQLAQKNFSRY